MRKEAKKMSWRSASWEASQIILVNQYYEDKESKGDKTEGICSTMGGYEKIMKI